MIVTIEFEREPRFTVTSDTYEDERRLLLWLHRSRSVRDSVVGVLDGIDEAA